MAARKTAKKAQKARPAPGKTIEQRLGAFAEQLGSLAGTVHNKADVWLDREAIGKELARIKANAADLLEYVNSMAPSSTPSVRKTKKPVVKRAAAPAKSAGRGPVDAPGKRHRQPPPQERGNRRMSQAKGSQTAPTIVKSVRRGGRG